MKMLATAAVLTAALATPALAQSFNPDFGTGNVGPAPYHGRVTQPLAYDGYGHAYAYAAPVYRQHVRHAHVRPHTHRGWKD